MKADLSRNSFDPARHASSVRLQQGRIVTDADWNEQADVTRHRAERLARDAIGACGAPVDGAGYALVAETNPFAIVAVGAAGAWVAGEDGALLASTDDGATWALADLATAAHLRGLAVAGNVGWAVGDDGTIRRTTDGGATWADRGAGSAWALHAVAATDADHAWAAGDGGSVLTTADGGVTWTTAATEASRLYAIDVADGINGLAVGQGGAIAATHDGGATWEAVASGTTAHLRALARSGATAVWACGDGGTVLRSTDGGATWAAAATPTAATLRAIGFRDANNGFAAGDGGTLLASGDGGATWTAIDAGTTATLRALVVAGSAAAWVAGDGGVLLRVDDGSPPVVQSLLPAVNLSIEPGRYWVHGTLCELDARCSYAHQADGGAGQRLAPGTHLVYLDAWQRHVSARQDPAIREVALGGVDTATRARTLAQVRTLPLPAESPDAWNCASQVDAWDALTAAPRPLLAARAEPQLAAASVCEIAATAGYRRLENQLYRVEVHEGGAAPSFKWSRENGSVEYAVVALSVDLAANQTIVRVAARGRDAGLDLALHDRVELVDDDTETTVRAGAMLEYAGDGDDALELVLDGVAPGTLGRDSLRHPLLRRWEQRPAGAGEHVLPIVEHNWIELEDGVQVRFDGGGAYRPGDYWTIPARTITADVEWPRGADGDPLALPPEGVADAWCRLGIVAVADDGTVEVVGDCRTLVPPLAAMLQLLLHSGDGQDALPGALLPQPLIVRVNNGALPRAGARVRFAIESGGGTLAAGGGSGAVVEVETGADGLASAQWTLGPGASAPQRFQRVAVSLLDAGAAPVPGQIVGFAATATPQPATGGGCDITIGPGGQFERLTSELLAQLLQRSGGSLCLCFLPGRHEIDSLRAEGGGQARLSLHGCGPTAQIAVRSGFAFSAFAALELRDLAVRFTATELGINLRANTELRLQGLSLSGPPDAPIATMLSVAGGGTLRLAACSVGPARIAAAVIEGLEGDVRIDGNRFDGVVSFYGPPGPDRLRDLIAVWSDLPPAELRAGSARLHFTDNMLRQLAVSAAMTERLLARNAEGLFESAVVQGNSFDAQSSLFAAARVAFGGNTFLAQASDRTVPYGVVVGIRAAASGNVAVVNNEGAILHFLRPRTGGFSGAANQVFTQPPSLN